MSSPLPIHPHATGARYEALLEVAESIAAHRQLATLFADLSRCLQRLVSFDYINLTLLDPKANVFRLHLLQTDHDLVGHAPPETPYDLSSSGLVLRTRQPYYVSDLDTAAALPGTRRVCCARTTCSRIAFCRYTPRSATWAD